jgi:hypothetical protein
MRTFSSVLLIFAMFLFASVFSLKSRTSTPPLQKSNPNLCSHPGDGCTPGEGKCCRGYSCPRGLGICREIEGGCLRINFDCEAGVSGQCCKGLTCDRMKSVCVIDKKKPAPKKSVEEPKDTDTDSDQQ